MNLQKMKLVSNSQNNNEMIKEWDSLFNRSEFENYEIKIDSLSHIVVLSKKNKTLAFETFADIWHPEKSFFELQKERLLEEQKVINSKINFCKKVIDLLQKE